MRCLNGFKKEVNTAKVKRDLPAESVYRRNSDSPEAEVAKYFKAYITIIYDKISSSKRAKNVHHRR